MLFILQKARVENRFLLVITKSLFMEIIIFILFMYRKVEEHVKNIKNQHTDEIYHFGKWLSNNLEVYLELARKMDLGGEILITSFRTN